VLALLLEDNAKLMVLELLLLDNDSKLTSSLCT
jgi:hypothetical protein